MTEQRWQTGTPPHDGWWLIKYGRHGLIEPRWWNSKDGYHSEDPDLFWAPIIFPPDPEPERQLIQQVIEALGIEQEIWLDDVAWQLIEDPPNAMWRRDRDALLWRVVREMHSRGWEWYIECNAVCLQGDGKYIKFGHMDDAMLYVAAKALGVILLDADDDT